MRTSALVGVALLALAAGGAADAQRVPAPPALPAIRITPPVVSVAGVGDPVVSLDGADWLFLKDVPAPFDGTIAGADGWGPITVPGHFAFQGYGRMHRALDTPVAHARRFAVPEAWRGRRVHVRFGSVEGRARFWVNGTEVGEPVTSAHLPIELDVTDAVRFGAENEVVVTAETSLFASWIGSEKGGLQASVDLLALPPVNVAGLHVVGTDLDGAGGATVRVRVRVENETGRPARGLRLALALDGPGGAVDLAEPERPLPDVAAGGAATVLDVPLAAPRLWDPEHPHLYTLRATLLDGSAPLMTAERRFGVREIEVDGHRLLVNGRPVEVQGAVFMPSGPELGYTVPRELVRADVRTAVEANVDFLRADIIDARHYPEAADEMGAFVVAQPRLGGMQYAAGPDGSYGDHPEFEPIVLAYAARMLEALRSHPSVAVWATANESPYYDYFRAMAEAVRAEDPTRPVIHSSDLRLGIGVEGVQVNDDHYPLGGTGSVDTLGVIRGGEWDFPEDRPILFTEWLHQHMTNATERQLDPGIYDEWGRYAVAHVDYAWSEPHVLGGFTFAALPATTMRVDNQWGYVDTWRRPKASYYHLKRAYAPVRVLQTEFGGADGGVSDGALLVPVHNRSDFSDLSELEVTAEQGGRVRPVETPDVGPHARGTLRVPFDSVLGRDTVVVTFRHPARDLEVERVALVFDDGETITVEAVPAPPAPLRVERGVRRTTIAGDGFSWTLDHLTGLVAAAEVGGEPVLMGGPHAVVLQSAHRRYDDANRPVTDQLGAWELERMALEEGGGAVVVRSDGRWGRGGGGYTLRFTPDGALDVAYRVEWTGRDTVDVYQAGLRFDAPPRLDRLVWDRGAQWALYPEGHIGRPRGSAWRTGDVADGVRASHVEGTAPPWPWAQDLWRGATRDFRATRRAIRTAALLAGDGTGVAVDGGGRQHVRAEPLAEGGGTSTASGGGVAFHVLDVWNGGTEHHLVKSVRLETAFAEPGAVFEGAVRLRLVRP